MRQLIMISDITTQFGLHNYAIQSTLITAKLRDKTHNKKLNLEDNPSDQQYTRHTENRIRQKNAKC